MHSIWPQNTSIWGRKRTHRVFVGLSGGVDSAVSAALLKKQGWDVTGVFIKIALAGYPCPAGVDRIEAMRVAAHLEIPFLELDLSSAYQEEVFKVSIREFEKGRTPNPDALCNREIKFGKFYEFAKSKGADAIATGHYAQIKEGKLYTSRDTEKDQTYFLWALPQEAAGSVIFPVGQLHKEEVRSLARGFGLPNAARKDSQGLCFLGDISIEDMLTREVPLEEGKVLLEDGSIVGTHRGAALYTLGQRHGFEHAIHTPTTEPYFVIGKDVIRNTITIAPSRFPKHAKKTLLELTDTNWIGDVHDGLYKAQYRYRGARIPAHLHREGKKTTVTLEEAHYVPLGQSLVLYDDERCLGGGVVENATLEA